MREHFTLSLTGRLIVPSTHKQSQPLVVLFTTLTVSEGHNQRVEYVSAGLRVCHQFCDVIVRIQQDICSILHHRELQIVHELVYEELCDRFL